MRESTSVCRTHFSLSPEHSLGWGCIPFASLSRDGRGGGVGSIGSLLQSSATLCLREPPLLSAPTALHCQRLTEHLMHTRTFSEKGLGDKETEVPTLMGLK